MPSDAGDGTDEFDQDAGREFIDEYRDLKDTLTDRQIQELRFRLQDERNRRKARGRKGERPEWPTAGSRNEHYVGDDESDGDGGQEHPTPTCPNCGGEKTRPLDREVADCFECDASWHYDEDYSAFWDGETA